MQQRAILMTRIELAILFITIFVANTALGDGFPGGNPSLGGDWGDQPQG